MITWGPLTNDLTKVNPPRKVYEKHLGSEPKLSIQKVLSRVFRFSSEMSGLENRFKPEPLKNPLFFPTSTHLLSISTTRNMVFSRWFSCLVFKSALSYLFHHHHHHHHHHHDHLPWTFTSQYVAPNGHWFSRFRDQDEVCTGPEREVTGARCQGIVWCNYGILTSISWDIV